MRLFNFVLLALLSVAVLQRVRRPDILTVSLVWMSSVAIGFIVIGESGSPIFCVYLAALLALVCGHRLQRVAFTAYAPPTRDSSVRVFDYAVDLTPALRILLVALCGLAVYHFSRVGIPLFRSDVELARWSIADSGLFGVPGRAVTVGIPAVYTFAVGWRRKCAKAYRRSADRFHKWSLLAFAVVSVLSGFKGALLKVAVPLLILEFALSEHRLTRQQIRRYGSVIVLAAAGVIAIGGLYSSYQGEPIVAQIARRSSSNVAQIATYTMRLRHDPRFPDVGNTYLNDLRSIVGSYVQGRTTGGELFLRQVSAWRSGRSTSGAFAVPITPTGIAVAYYNYAGIITILLYVFFGWLVAKCAQIMRGTRRFGPFVLAASGALWVHSQMTGGGGVFGLVNMSAVILPMLLAVRLYRNSVARRRFTTRAAFADWHPHQLSGG